MKMVKEFVSSLKKRPLALYLFFVTVFAIIPAFCYSNRTSNEENSKVVIERLKRMSWAIYLGETNGSGVMVTRGDTHYLFTAGHLVDEGQHINHILDPKTKQRTISVVYDRFIVKQIERENNAIVGEHYYYADVIRHSSQHGGEDLAVLRLRKRGLTKETSVFCDVTPSSGDQLWHIGSPSREFNTISAGIFSQAGCLKRDGHLICDQITIPADHGSSGCGVFNQKDGKCIGLVVLGNPNAIEAQQIYIRPAREIKKWAKRVGIEFLTDSTKPIPTDDEINQYPIYDVPVRVPARKINFGSYSISIYE